MTTFVLIIHSIACILLVLTVLMQAGRGGGLTESFSSAESVFGAQTSAFLVKTTAILAAVFFTTSLTLAYFSTHHDRSLMLQEKEKASKTKAVSAGTKAVNEASSVTVPAVNAVAAPTAPSAQ